MTLKNKLILILYQTIEFQSDASTGQFCKSTIYLPLKANRNSDAGQYNLMSKNSVFLPQEPHEHKEKVKRYDTRREDPQVSRCPICY